jgi:hypothetical protein
MAELPPHPSLICGRGTLHNPPLKFIPPPEGVVVGKFCSFGPNLKIIGTNHDYNFPAIQYTFYRRYFNKDHPTDSAARTHSKGVTGQYKFTPLSSVEGRKFYDGSLSRINKALTEGEGLNLF